MSYPLSQFLPPDFRPEDGIGLIAGKELYPEIVARRMLKAGVRVGLIAFEGETRESLFQMFPKGDRVRLKVGQMGKLLKALKDFRVKWAMMAGQVTPGRLFKDLHPDLKAITLLAKLREKNAESIFGAVSEEIAKLGIRLIDARGFLDDQMTEIGPMTKIREKVRPDFIAHGIEMAKEVARLDIGQGVVIRKGVVVAVEAFEGTDRMLRRAGSFDTNQLVFVKAVKPRQDFRFDVPVFGMRTLEVMKEAGIHHGYLEANKTIILEKEEVLRRAEAWKIQLVGFAAG